MNALQWHVEKIHHVVWDSLYVYNRIECQQALKDLEKTPNIAYEDALKKFDLVWCVKGFIMTHSNVTVTWKAISRMIIIS